IKADSVTSGATVVSGIGIDLKRDGDWTNFSGGATASGIPATATGRVKIAGGKTSVEIASGEATVRGIKAAIAEPSSLSIAGGITTVEKLALDLGGGSVALSGNAGQTLDLTANFAKLPAALANDFVPGLDAAGTLEGTAHVTGPSSNPDVRFNAKLAGAETSQTRQAGLGPLNLDVAGSASTAGGLVIDQATLSGDKISGKAAGTINPNGASDFSLDLASNGPSLPLKFGTAESPVELEMQTLSMKAAGQGATPRLDISATLPSATANHIKVEGLALALHSDGFDVKSRTGPVSGTVAADKIDLDNPTVAPLVAGKVTAKVAGSLAPDALTINSGSATSGAVDGAFNGRVSFADGSVDFTVKADVLSAALPAAARGVLAERTQFSATTQRDAKGNVSVGPVKVASGAFTADGQASIADNTLNAA
ncbi:translocation/assembly module TamB, partial [Mesorhizobium sp. M1E.F.Ca.ET.063.01.1.1]